MGTDKALLPHPEGGSWLERTLRLLLALEIPVTLLSRHARHLQLARALLPSPGQSPSRLTAIAEPEPWQGPLLALHRLMERHPEQLLLLAPVDMPLLRQQDLQALLAAAASFQPLALEHWPMHLAHDGERLQPLLGLYPSPLSRRRQLAAAIAAGERRLQHWLMTQPCRAVPLERQALCNINRPSELPPAWL